MDVAVLHPQDCLRNPLKGQYPRTHLPLKTPKKSNPIPNPNHNKNRRRRSPEKSPKSSPPPPPVKNLAIGQVKILKRGEAISDSMKIGGSGAVGLGTTGRLGPDPDLVRSQVHYPARSYPSVVGFYAGSVVMSPPPSSVPLPGFFTRKSVTHTVVNQESDATSDLRRLLGLN